MIADFLQNDLFEGIVSKHEFLELNYKNLVQKKGTALICIHDPAFYFHDEKILEGYDDVLQTEFWDIEGPWGDLDPIEDWQGLEIKNFILKNKDKKFLIHCSAGISRSAGVACAVECLVKYDDLYSYSTSHSSVRAHHRYSPNYKVFDTIVKNG